MPSKQMVEFHPPMRAHQADDKRGPPQMQMGGGDIPTQQIGCSAEVSWGGTGSLPLYTINDRDPMRPELTGGRTSALPTPRLGGT